MKLFFTGGGTAGHVTPNVALINLLCESHRCYYGGTLGMEKNLVAPLVESGKVISYETISASKLRRSFSLKNLLLPYFLYRSVKEAKRSLEKIRPDAVFGKGGYVSLPFVIAAKQLKIPAMIHESDASMGLANKVACRFADEVLSTFPQKNCKAVGAILRDVTNGNRQKGLKYAGFDGKKPILLVMGGSLGAAELNDTLALASNKLTEKFDVFVITGKGKKFSGKAHTAEFVENVADLYACCSVAVTRGGSNSLCELAACKIPFVAVPLQKGSRGEQLQNAAFFEKAGCSVTLCAPTPEQLTEAVLSVYETRQQRIAACEKINIDGTAAVAELLVKLAQNGKKPST